uniref:hypothetical protein n=1 Tax=Madagascaria erythrocladioides TaxID=753684 RepID=UPI001BF1100E|nr:hypothetical protein MW574_pgp039 [Madagascaria erythrocladioides]QUE29072.1 Ycf36 [Madagascaria erythrocladioides]UNJ16628.1 hypothetical protein [Madagascaria erythrocladioides]
MISHPEFCPVPIEQQPLQEYKSLLSSRFFSLPNKHFKKYLLNLLLASIVFCTATFTIFFYDFWFGDNSGKIILNIFIFNDLLMLSLILRLYLSWSYVVKRLLSATVFYEESGWYDGQIWVKPSEMLIRDRLMAINQGVPLVKQVKLSFLIFCLKLIIEGIISTTFF